MKISKGCIIWFIFLFFIPFITAQEYNGNFIINKEYIQLGDEFTVSGEILKDGVDFSNGFIFIEFIKNDDVLYKAPAVLDYGSFSSTQTFAKTPEGLSMLSGDYKVDVTLNDFFGNELKKFENVVKLKVSSEIVLDVNLDKTQVDPGDIIKISIETKEELGGKVKNADVIIIFDDHEFKTKLNGGILNYELGIASDIKSNYHDLKIIVEDENGNKGEKTSKIYVVAVPTRLSIETDKSDYLPSESIKINAKLYDQAGDQIVEKVKVKIYDVNNHLLQEKDILTNEFLNFELDGYAEPGTWKITGDSYDLKTQKEFVISRIEELNVNLVGQTLEIQNIGNVDYVKELEIQVTSKEKSHLIKKKSNLKPGQTIYVGLFREVPPDTYDIKLGDFSFSDVTIVDERNTLEKSSDFFKGVTGSVVGAPGSSVSKKPLISLIIVLAILVGLFFGIRQKYIKKNEKIKQRERNKAKQMVESLKKSKEKISRKFGYSTKDDIKDFKDRIRKDIEKHSLDKKERPPGGSPGDFSGAFKMFD